ncbi:MAG: CotH kinase family protein [bacterium]|nr:CotH kinase family protein [bacterium]
MFPFARKTKIRMFLIALFLFVLLLGGMFSVLRFSSNARYALLRNDFLQNFLHTYRSFSRMSNILFLPYWFASSGLPQYELVLDPKDLIRLNEHLPQDPIDGQKLEDDQFDIKGYFIASDYGGAVKVRYRGKSANHWNAEQRSFRVEFPKENLFRGMRVLSLVIPYDRQYFVEPLNMYRAEKLGLRAPEMSFVEIKLQGKSSGGVYLAFEGFSKEWLDKNEGTDEFSLFTVRDDTRQDPDTNPPPLFSEEGIARWQLSNRKDVFAEDSEELTALRDLLVKANDAEFERLAPYLINLDQFYGWEMLNILAASAHQDDYWNLVMVFNSVTGRFEFIPWDVDTDLDSDYIDQFLREPTTLVAKRILSVPAFRQEFTKRLAAYVNDQKNLEDDVRFYNDLFQKTRVGFYKDNAKFFSTLEFRSQVQEYRDALIAHFERTRGVLARGEGGEYRFVRDETPKSIFGGSFSEFERLSVTVGEFLSRHPQFYLSDASTLSLGPGVYSFRESVLIPAGFRVVIQPGTDIYLGGEVSFVSWSPVEARGEEYTPIRVRRFSLQKPFGVFAVVNTGGQKNYFTHFDIEGGFQARINGMVLKGQMSVHNSDVEIRHSRFAGASADDAINVVYRDVLIADSFFENNTSDNIDLDFVRGAVLNSVFRNPEGGSNGDALDLSGSRVEIVGNTIEGCGDKGLSIGEHSFARVRRNTVVGCAIGVAVKDLSEAFFVHNTFLFNKTAIEAYQKKSVFGGGTIWMSDSVVWGNEKDTDIASGSSLFAQQSTTERGLAGRGNTSQKPDFRQLLPASIYEAIKDRL